MVIRMKKIYLFIFSLLCLFSFSIVVYAEPLELEIGKSADIPGEYHGASIDGLNLERNAYGDTLVTCIKEGRYIFNTYTFMNVGASQTQYTNHYTVVCSKPEGEEEVYDDSEVEDPAKSETLRNLCNVNENPDAMRAFKLGGLALNILKIMIPILLIILGSIDFAQAVISNDEKQISKSTMKLVQRVIAGIVIFLAPKLIEYVFDLVDTNATNRYHDCYKCLFDVSECPEIPKVGENK